MKKLLAFTCAMVMAACAFAASNLKADDCALGPASSSEIKPGFSFVVEKEIVVVDKSTEPIKNGDVSYSKRIKFEGANDEIKFTAKKGEVLTVVATSSSKTESRSVTVRPADKPGKKLISIPCPAWNMKSPKFSNKTFTIPEDGEYIVRGTGGGIYLFEIDLK